MCIRDRALAGHDLGLISEAGLPAVAEMCIRDSHQLVQRQLQLARGAVHDADVGLVRDQPVQVGLGPAGLFQHCTRRAVQHVDGQFEDGLAVHLEQRIAQHLPATDRARHAENGHVAAIGVQVGGQDARLCAGCQLSLIHI